MHGGESAAAMSRQDSGFRVQQADSAQQGTRSFDTPHSALRIPHSLNPEPRTLNPLRAGDLMSPSMASVPCVASLRHNTSEVS